MKCVYSTRLEGVYETPIIMEYVKWLIKIAALCPGKSHIRGVLKTDDFLRMLEELETCGATAYRDEQGVTVEGCPDSMEAFNSVFGEIVKNVKLFDAPELSGTDGIFQRENIIIDGEPDPDTLAAVILGNIVHGNSQTLRLPGNMNLEPSFYNVLEAIKAFGGFVEVRSEHEIYVGGAFPLSAGKIVAAAGEFGLGAFGLVLSAFNPKLSVSNVFETSTFVKRSGFISLISEFGLTFSADYSGVASLTGLEACVPPQIDCKKAAEYLPYLMFLATRIEGETEFYNIDSWVVEAFDGALYYTVSMLLSLGARIEAKRAGTISIKGGGKFAGGAKLDCHDNFIVASTAVLLSLASEKSNIIDNADVLTEKYPDFWERFSRVGGFAE